MFRSRSLAALAVAAAAVLATRGPAPSAGHDDKKEMAALHRPAGLRWQDGPPSLPPGAKFSVLEGDPAKPGPFVFRVKVPDGYKIPPHTHPKTERVTVISGTFNLGTGEKFDAAKGEALPAGSYGTWPAGMKHYVWATGETVVQFHGEGPWVIEYLDPADDPRKGKK
jgi:quercetin dioxygenase-like cupin family protein